MPSVIVKTIFFDLDKLAWTLTAGGNALLQPLTIGQNDTIDFNVQFIKSGAAQTLTSPTFTAGIKVLNGFSDSFVVQFGAPTGTPPTYTFTATISSTELSAALLTGAQFAIEFRDSTNGIVTLPALTLNIVASYTISGTTPTSANGTLNVTAGKTVTFPQSLTFPSALGTNGFQLTTDGAGALTWAASGALTDGDKGDITVSSSGAQWTIDNDTIGLAKLAHMTTNRVIGRTTPGNGAPELLTISGTGSVAMTNTPTLVTPVLGEATATSINGITITAGGSGTLTIDGNINTGEGGGSINTSEGGNIDTSEGGGSITTSSSGGSINTTLGGGGINTSDGGGAINTYGLGDTQGGAINTYAGSGIGTGGNISTYGVVDVSGGSINTSNGGGAINTRGNGSIGLGIVANRTYLVSTAGNNEKTATFPNVTGTVAVGAHSATTTHAMFSAGAAGYTTRAIATADIATALTTPGAIGGTTAGTGAFTTISGTSTLTLGVVSTTAGTIVLRNASNALTTTIVPGVVTGTSKQLNLPIITGTDTVAVLGLEQTFTKTKTFSEPTNDGIFVAAPYSSGRNFIQCKDTTFNRSLTISQDGSVDYQITVPTTLVLQSSLVDIVSGLKLRDEVLAPALNAGFAVAITITSSGFALNGVNAATLANGANGQLKFICCTAVTAAGTATLTPTTSAADYNTISFTAAGQTATLQYYAIGGWHIISLRGAVAA